jgi:hypothetical protein
MFNYVIMHMDDFSFYCLHIFMWLTVDKVWIGNWIYWTLRKINYIFTDCCLITVSNSVASSASVLMSLLPGDCLTTNSYSSHCRLKTFSQSQLLLVIVYARTA